ncbi:unnamed protein product [Rhizophagus irregularis]|nr:hypothetical protein RirG_271670 [Rhizophagus irregularis DAOM 197198w]CAB5188834.1 unnamed protein product [Rhizophagus irregularis]
MFDKLLYNGMKETYENRISFPKISSSGMEIVLEFIYTGSIEERTLTEDNIIEVFYAADYLQITDLQKYIVKIVNNTFETENYFPELLSKIAGMMPLAEDNALLDLLIEMVAIIPLNTIEFSRLSIAGLQYLLSYTHEKEKPFVTPEYEVFRYSAILAAKQVSNDAFITIMERLPTLERVENLFQTENKFITDNQKITKELEPLVKYIDFNQIKGNILTDIIEPLEIVSPKIILDAYRQKARSHKTDLNGIRGVHINESNYTWDESCDSSLFIEENGKLVSAKSNCNLQTCVKANLTLENQGIFEWDVIIEKLCEYAWIGVCAPENFNCLAFAGYQTTGWVLGSNGLCWNSRKEIRYCLPFGEGTRITVHLDMNKRTCAFTVNGIRYPEVSTWNNLPSKLYPVAGLIYPGRFRIQSYRKV